ncbi:uncharacterized protein SOCG_03612 [Schizosaccharomyces octosporus yFS286]|uniref:Uncharacterized protein n=1 Tax=Schizosaccharomyces octosporus (strain yFS286) TaxID=483514 RepID=S9Q416_SCHOY|nr:uncharacterized protein SOCG_03612 [Schizosaccharomyces octosporus yFS286]EPX74403.1 hypothetical protein SOCG_03612 [Schizosaccharomyces octosporus yFS286]
MINCLGSKNIPSLKIERTNTFSSTEKWIHPQRNNLDPNLGFVKERLIILNQLIIMTGVTTRPAICIHTHANEVAGNNMQVTLSTLTKDDPTGFHYPKMMQAMNPMQWVIGKRKASSITGRRKQAARYQNKDKVKYK